MDNVTHGLAGLLIADAAVQWVERRGVRVPARFRGAASVLGVVAAEFPDSDLLYSGPVLRMGKLGYLLHHRGHTHTIVWALVSAVLLWLLTRWWVARRMSGDERVWLRLFGSGPLLAIAVVGTLSHIALDYTNSYGVHPFWPFDGRWVYGDAVFIVEPWLWLVAIPPLWAARGRVGRALIGLAFVGIVAASLFTGQVARDVSLVLLAFAIAWPLLQRVLPHGVRVPSGVVAWGVATAVFFLSSQRAEATVRAVVGGDVRDVVLNPAPGDPTCWSALVVTVNDTEYRLTSSLVAPYRSVRTPAQCERGYSAGRVSSDVLAPLPEATTAVPFTVAPAVTWRRTWSVPRGALGELAAARCEVDAALYFMRTPAWTWLAGDTLLLADARYGAAAGGFNSVLAGRSCGAKGAWVPGWERPRGDVLGR